MNLIQANTEYVKWYTNLRNVAKWLNIGIDDYSWHMSDLEIYPHWEGFSDPCWRTGKELRKYVEEHNPQFIWAVLSTFPKDCKPFLSHKPYADMNPDFWTGTPQKQLEDSLFEIVCFDSSCTLFIGLPENLSRNLINNAPGILDLNRENEKRIKDSDPNIT